MMIILKKMMYGGKMTKDEAKRRANLGHDVACGVIRVEYPNMKD
jgi:hypothetical protein